MKPVIIIGAGASHDYISDEHLIKDKSWCPPLTNNIFHDQQYQNILAKYPEVVDLATDAMRKVPDKMSLEQYLNKIRDTRASTDANRQKQLVALSFYLQDLFHQITGSYGSQLRNNYRALLGIIKDNGGEACVVNFNYDGLLEQNIPDITDTIESYIRGAVNVIKLHGSYDWVYHLDQWFHDQSSYDFLMKNPWFLTLPDHNKSTLYPFRRIDLNQRYLDPQRNIHFFPAIAVPLVNKEIYICPDNHITVLKRALNNTDRILIIGWKAGDKNLISIMEEEIKNKVKITVVSRGIDSANKIIKNLSQIENATFIASDRIGFSSFLTSDESDNFFTN